MSGLPEPPQSKTSSLTPCSTVTNSTLCGDESVCAESLKANRNDAARRRRNWCVLGTIISFGKPPLPMVPQLGGERACGHLALDLSPTREAPATILEGARSFVTSVNAAAQHYQFQTDPLPRIRE